MSVDVFHARENEAIQRLGDFILEVQSDRLHRGEPPVREHAKFIAKLMRRLNLFSAQQVANARREGMRQRVELIAHLSGELNDLLSTLDRDERELLMKGDFSDTLRQVKSVNEAAALLLTKPKRGRKGNAVLQNIAAGFVLDCIDHNWLPIRVSNSVLLQSSQSEHCRCLALLLEIAGVNKKTSVKGRQELLIDMAANQLRKLRKGFNYVPTDDQDSIWTAKFSGRVHFARIWNYPTDEEVEPDIQPLPNFHPSKASPQ